MSKNVFFLVFISFLFYLNASCPLFCQTAKKLEGPNFSLFKIVKLKNTEDENGYCIKILDRLKKEKGPNNHRSLNKPIPINWIENDIVLKRGQEIWIINPGETTKIIKSHIKEFYVSDSSEGFVLSFRTDKDELIKKDSVYLTFPKNETHNISSESMEKFSAKNTKIIKGMKPTGIFLIDGTAYLIRDDSDGYKWTRKIFQLGKGTIKEICSSAISD